MMAYNGDIDGVAAFLAENSEQIEATDETGNTMFHCACWGKQLGVIAVLMANNANANAIGCLGRTPLHYAVHEGSATSVPIVEALLDYGADPELSDNGGYTPADWAKVQFVDSSLVDVLKALNRSG